MDLDQPSTAPAPALSGFSPAVAPRKRRFPWLMILFAFAAGIAAMGVALHYYSRWVPATQPLVAAVPVGAGAPVAPKAAAAPTIALPTIDTLSARESELAGRLAILEARAAAIQTDSRMAAGNAGRAEALLIALSARRALDRGQQLGYVEEQLKLRFGARQPAEVNLILQAARTPLTVEELRTSLDGVAPLLTTGAAKEGWWASFRREIGGLIVIRQAGSPSTMPDDRLSRAHRALDAGHVEAALAEIAQMPGAASANAWIAAARRYVAAHQALDALETAALRGEAGRI